MEMTQIFHAFGLNVKTFSHEEIDIPDHTKDIFTLESEEEDYYIFERLESRMRFKIPEITEMSLLKMQ